MWLVGCRTVPAVVEVPASFEVVLRGSGRNLGPWSGTALEPHTALHPLDAHVDPGLLVRSLAGRGVRALSLVGVGWAGTSHLADLESLPLDWLDLSETTLEPGALSTVRAPRLVLERTNLTDALLRELPSTVRELQLRGTRVTEECVPWLLRLPRLESLGLGQTRLSANGIAHLQVPTLRELDLAELPLEDASLTVLGGMPDLEVLSLAGTNTTDYGLRHLRTLTRLTSLNLSDTGVTDEGLVGLDAAVGLTDLFLANVSVGAPTVARLGHLTQLRTLDLSGTAIDGSATKTLANLSALESLSLAKTRQTSESISRLRGLRALRELDLEHTRVDAKVMEALADLSSLVGLDLSETSLKEARFDQLPRTLRVLRLGQSAAPVAGLRALPGLARLEVLDVSGLEVSDGDLQFLSDHARALERLNVNFTSVGDAGVKALAQLPVLQRLDVGKTRLTGVGVAALATAPALRVLELGLNDLDDDAVLQLEATQLRKLYLAETKVTDQVVEHLPRTLVSLNLDGTHITQRAVSVLTRYRSLREVDVRHTGVDASELRRLGVDVK